MVHQLFIMEIWQTKLVPAPLLNVLWSNKCILGPRLPNKWAGNPRASNRAAKTKQYYYNKQGEKHKSAAAYYII